MAYKSCDSYMFWIRNRSGVTASYAIIAAPPLVEPPINPTHISTPIICVFRHVPSGNGAVRFEIPKDIHACCGTALHDRMDQSPTLEIFDQRLVAFTSRPLRGTNYSGPLLHMVVDSGQPAFGKDGVQTDRPDTFSIETQPDFTAAEARSSMFITHQSPPYLTAADRSRGILCWSLRALERCQDS